MKLSLLYPMYLNIFSFRLLSNKYPIILIEFLCDWIVYKNWIKYLLLFLARMNARPNHLNNQYSWRLVMFFQSLA